MKWNASFSFIIFLTGACTCFLNTATAQYEEENFVRYTTRDGLSDNYITCLQQDDWGYIWIGTDNGLNRFDGYIFKKYIQGAPPVSLPSQGILSLRNFGSDRLGILTYNGFIVLDTRNFVQQDYLVPGHPAFVQRNAVRDVYLLPDSSFLLSTSTGVYRFHQNGHLMYRYDAFSEQHALSARLMYAREIYPVSPDEYYIYLHQNNLGRFRVSENLFEEFTKEDPVFPVFRSLTENKVDWSFKGRLGSDEYIFINKWKDSIVHYHHAKKQITISALPPNMSSAFNWQSSLCRLNDSLFAISHYTAGFYLFRINRQTGAISVIRDKQLPAQKIQCLFTDHEGRLWVGTTNGLLQQKLKKKFISTFQIPLPAHDTLNSFFTAGLRYKNKLYLTRFSRSSGLMILDPASLSVLKTVSFFGTDNQWNEIRSIQLYHPDTLWLGTNAGILWYDTRTHHYGKLRELKPYSAIQNLAWLLSARQPDGYAWMSGYLNGIVARYHIDTRTFTFFHTSSTPALPFLKNKFIVSDAYGDVWISGHALARWNQQLQQFDTLITTYAGRNKYNDDIVTITADAYGSLWLHNAYNGLLQYRVKDKAFTAYDLQHGLPSSDIRCLSNIFDSILWIGHNNYLTHFNILNKKCRIYDFRDGFPDTRPIARQILYDEIDSLCYLFFDNMISRFPVNEPARLYSTSSLLLEEIAVNNNKKYFFADRAFSFPPNTEMVSLRFTVIDYEEGNNYRFFYKLNDAPAWTDAGSDRQINFMSLPSGNYWMQLKSVNQSGEEMFMGFHFSIAPPFWKTGWFLLVFILFLTGMVYLFYRRRIRQIRQRANLDKLLSQTEMKALHAQMNPHFIFNSLNSIREMILSNENMKASRYLGKFARLIRMTLDQSSLPFVTLRNTMDYLQHYIEMEQIRNERFTFSMYADAGINLDETVMPPMLIQPFIENAIWHGGNGTADKISIQVKFEKQGDRLICMIEDNGIGIEQSMQNKSAFTGHHPVGISNIQNRVRLLNEKYGFRSSLTIEDKSRIHHIKQTGTLVRLEMPIDISEV